MKYLFIEYPKCTTCRKAKKWLLEHGVEFESRHIVEQNPTAEELADWYRESGLLLKKFFNTSGMLYKEFQLKEKLPSMSEQEQLSLLSTNGMLVKRPLLIGGGEGVCRLSAEGMGADSLIFRQKDVGNL